MLVTIPPRRVAVVVAVVILLAYAGALAYLFAFQRSYVFHPGGSATAPAASGLGSMRTVELAASDGTILNGWHAPAQPGRPTLLYFQGNAGPLADRAERFGEVLASGFGLLAVSYRGYAGSGGSPSETALFADALVIFDWLAEQADTVVLHGESLGSGVAAYVAAERLARALILEAPYTAALDIAAETYPWVPTSYLMRDAFLTRDHIRRVTEPVLVVHGTNDDVIPVAHGRRVFELANEPKQLAIMDGATHGNLWENGLWPAALKFLAQNGVMAQPEAAVRRMPSLAG